MVYDVNKWFTCVQSNADKQKVVRKSKTDRRLLQKLQIQIDQEASLYIFLWFMYNILAHTTRNITKTIANIKKDIKTS